MRILLPPAVWRRQRPYLWQRWRQRASYSWHCYAPLWCYWLMRFKASRLAQTGTPDFVQDTNTAAMCVDCHDRNIVTFLNAFKHSADYVVCSSVCLSVFASHAGIVWKLLNVSSNFFHRRVAPWTTLNSDKCTKNCCFTTMCKAHRKVSHTKHHNIFITSRAVDIIKIVYYIHGPWGDENIFVVLYVSFFMGLTHCCKTAVFTFIFAVFLLNLFYSFRQMLPAISAAGL